MKAHKLLKRYFWIVIIICFSLQTLSACGRSEPSGIKQVEALSDEDTRILEELLKPRPVLRMPFATAIWLTDKYGQYFDEYYPNINVEEYAPQYDVQLMEAWRHSNTNVPINELQQTVLPENFLLFRSYLNDDLDRAKSCESVVSDAVQPLVRDLDLGMDWSRTFGLQHEGREYAVLELTAVQNIGDYANPLIVILDINDCQILGATSWSTRGVNSFDNYERSNTRTRPDGYVGGRVPSFSLTTRFIRGYDVLLDVKSNCFLVVFERKFSQGGTVQVYFEAGPEIVSFEERLRDKQNVSLDELVSLPGVNEIRIRPKTYDRSPSAVAVIEQSSNPPVFVIPNQINLSDPFPYRGGFSNASVSQDDQIIIIPDSR